MTAAALIERAPDSAASSGGRLIRDVLRSPRGALAVGFLALITLACVLAPIVAPYDPLLQHLAAVRQGPSAAFPVGTDSLGRDLLSRLLYGGRVSLLGVVEAVAAQLIVAVPAGLVAGYLGGLTDRIIMRIAELIMSVPVIVMLLAVLSIFGSSTTAAMVALGVLGSAGLMRVVRGTAAAAREELYVTAAELMGRGRIQVMLRHVLVHCRGAIIVQGSLFAAIALGVQAGLDFLGLGPPPPAPTWGGMVADASSVFNEDPWMLVPPGVVIALTVLAFGVCGDVVRDVTAQRQSAGGAAAPVRRRRADGDAPSVPVAPTGALLAVQHLSVTTGTGDETVRLLDDVGFEIQAGETVGLVGESGCGKSMTARAILGLLPGGCRVESGHVLLGGQALDQMDERAYRAVRGRRIAMIAQEPISALDPSFRIGSLVAEVVRAVDGLRGPALHARTMELLTMVNIPDPESVAKRYPHQISGGMAQRVAIAMALAGRPELLIADEPTTALDVTIQAEILDLLRALQEATGMAVLLVTHNWGVVADTCSRVVVMYAGQVVETAATQDVFNTPAHPYTRALLRSSPQNTPRGEAITAIPGSVPPPGGWPAGCRFGNRCPLAQPRCQERAIPIAVPTRGRESRCVRTDELLTSGDAR